MSGPQFNRHGRPYITHPKQAQLAKAKGNRRPRTRHSGAGRNPGAPAFAL